MTDPVSDPAASSSESLVEYIRANRDRYTREALTAHLVRSGWAEHAVASAWAAAGADGSHELAAGAPSRTRQTVLSAIAILLAFGALALGEVTILAASGGRPMMLLYLVLYPIQIILVTRWIVGRIGKSGALRRGDAAMTVGWLVLPVIALLATMGVCYGYGAAFGCVIEC